MRLPTPILYTAALLACDPGSAPSADEAEFRAPIRAMRGNYELAMDGSHASRATASVESYVLDEAGKVLAVEDFSVRGTCGSTFISPHYAITAAHCVAESMVPDPAVNLVWVTSYDITNAEDWHLLFLGFLDGFYPHYVPWIGVDDIVGYESEGYGCSVVARCAGGQSGTPIACTNAGDIAMLYCPDRPEDAPWLEVADSDPGEGPVEMYWFHEVLDMPLSGPGFTPEEKDRVRHYVNYTPPPNLGENYHYLDAKATLLPLRSIPWEGGAERKRLPGNWTDLYGCHGTSGSGVLQRNDADELELLGPVTNGSITWVSRLLCTDIHPDVFDEGTANLQYAANSLLRDLLVDHWEVLNLDRLKGGVVQP